MSSWNYFPFPVIQFLFPWIGIVFTQMQCSKVFHWFLQNPAGMQLPTYKCDGFPVQWCCCLHLLLLQSITQGHLCLHWIHQQLLEGWMLAILPMRWLLSIVATLLLSVDNDASSSHRRKSYTLQLPSILPHCCVKYEDICSLETYFSCGSFNFDNTPQLPLSDCIWHKDQILQQDQGLSWYCHNEKNGRSAMYSAHN